MCPPHYLTESVCPLFGSVHTVNAGTSYVSGENSRFMSSLQFLPALSEGHKLKTPVTETYFGVKSEILLFKKIS